MNALDRLWTSIQALFEREKERGLGINDMFVQVWDRAAEVDEYAWLNDLYMEDDGSMSAILSVRGKLYKAPVMVENSNVSLGEWAEVKIEYTPRENFRIERQADGTYRWFSITETAVLLRVGELDSRALFDSLIENIAENGWPVLRFFHTPGLDFGVADWAAREERKK